MNSNILTTTVDFCALYSLENQMDFLEKLTQGGTDVQCGPINTKQNKPKITVR